MHAQNFTCPNCKVLAEQDWIDISNISDRVKAAIELTYYNYRKSINAFKQDVVENYTNYLNQQIEAFLELKIAKSVSYAICKSCNDVTIWCDSQMIIPRESLIQPPNQDLKDDIRSIYNEAALIYQDSPRASAALLRLCVEELCIQLGEEDGNLFDRIGNLVKQGLSEQTKKALEVCRVVGNDAVHPGEIDMNENPEIVLALFGLINYIAHEMITKPREIEELFSFLPEEKRNSIEQRDKN